MVVHFNDLTPNKPWVNVHITWDSVLSSGAGSGAVMFSGGVDGVLAQAVHVVDMGFTVSATKN